MTARRVLETVETEQLQTVRRALAVLEALAARPSGASPKELSQALDLHLSTCYRLLNALVAAGYATRTGGLFRVGARGLRSPWLPGGRATTARRHSLHSCAATDHWGDSHVEPAGWG
jgi:hypothetical protein